MDVVLYLRYSDDKQTEQSIEGQDRVATEFCRREGYNIINKYVDRAHSASKDTNKRTEFLRMIADSEKGRFHGVIVYKLDRFARNRYDSAIYKARLKRNGVRVISATENISDNPEGVLLESLLEGMAEFYSKELAQKVTRGMNESALKCNSTGGTLPLGYKVDKPSKKLVIYEPDAEIVREAFRRYAAGESITEIIRSFNDRGLRTSKGAQFNKNSFKTMFKNEKYIGIYKYDKVRIEGGMPAIIDQETFDIVQKRLKINEHAPAASKAKVDYLLSSKLFCGHCGGKMVGVSGTSMTGKQYFYYYCQSQRQHLCTKTPLQKDAIERAVAQRAAEMLTPELINQIADMAMEQLDEDIVNDDLIPALTAEIADINRSINNLLKLVEQGAESETLSKRLTELEKNKKAAQRRLDERQDEYPQLEKVHIVWWLSRFRHGNAEDPEFRKDIIDLLVNSVTVWDDEDGGYKLTLLYNLTDGNTETIRLSEDNSSYMSSCGSPKEFNTNYFVLPLNRVFGSTTKCHL